MEAEVTVITVDLYRTANLLIQQYGTEDALLVTAKRVDALLGLGDGTPHRTKKSPRRPSPRG